MNNNICLLADAYKNSHHLSYPTNTTRIHSYFESRGGEFNKIVFFGLQYYLQEYLAGPVLDTDKISEAKNIIDNSMRLGLFPEEKWKYILDNHNGCLPVKICAVPEGTICSPRQVLMTIENTDPNCAWLTSFLETLLVKIWYPCTVASQSLFIRDNLERFVEESGEQESIPFMLNDFGMRGVSSSESAEIGGGAHLTVFSGTDTLSAISWLMNYYGATPNCGGSVYATEHSVSTTWGPNREAEYLEHQLDNNPDSIVSVVGDTYNIFRFTKELVCEKFKDKIQQRKFPLVLRPDSGEPKEVLIRLLNILKSDYGMDKNSKGYWILPPSLRLLQGDGIDRFSINEICRAIMSHGFSVDNLIFGSGGGLLQKLNRDTCKFAFKASWAEEDGIGRDIYKRPITDAGKQSKAGRFDDIGLVPVFENGNVLHDYSLEKIRERINAN